MPGDIAPVMGHKFTMKTQPMGKWDGVIDCEIIAVELERKLAYSWKGGSDDNDVYGKRLDTVATWTLTPKPGGTLLLLEHSGFRAEDEFAFTTMGGGWKSHAGPRLKTVLETLG